MTGEYAGLIPKDLSENITFREELWKMGMNGTERDREELMGMCGSDILFWWNAFAWTFNARNPEGMREIPFITYEYQDEAILEINNAIGNGYDLVTEKSRDMGGTWMGLGVPVWRCLFKSGERHLVVSRKEDMVDKPGDPDCLFWRIDFFLSHLPAWMRPSPERSHMHVGFPETSSSIDGESTTGNLGRGGKRTSIFLDEFAMVQEGFAVLKATQFNSDCRHFNSTPMGMGNAYAVKAHDGTKKLTLHWSVHPEKRKGLYTTDAAGKLQVIDTDYRFPEDYRFVKDGKMRSVWYDMQCQRAGDAHEIAQELDIDYMGSEYQYFDPHAVRRHIMEYAVPPALRAEIEYAGESGVVQKYYPSEAGGLYLWMLPDMNGRMPANDEYVAGADISTGTGASNSVLSIWSKSRREKVAEYVRADMTPTEFAYASHALLRWFAGASGEGARLIFEAPGPGREYSKVLVEDCGYRNIWFMENEDNLAPSPTDKPGWWATKQSKLTLLGNYRHQIGGGHIANRSRVALEEMQYYIFRNGGVEHSGSVASEDPSGARENHGDRVIADALAVKLLGPASRKSNSDEEDLLMANPPEDSIAGRRKRRLEHERASTW